MKNWVGIKGGKVRRNVPCVGMSVSFMKKLQVLLYNKITMRTLNH